MFKVKSTGLVTTAESTGDRTLGELLKAVRERIGTHYELPTLAFNIECVNEDAKKGRIATPKTFEDWVAAIETEYNANQASFGKAYQQGKINLPVRLKPTPEDLAVLARIRSMYPRANN